MYLPLGADFSVRSTSIVGIFDLDNTSCSARGKEFLRRAEENGEVVPVSDELPKSFVLTQEFGMNRIYLSQFGSYTLQRRLHQQARQQGLDEGSEP